MKNNYWRKIGVLLILIFILDMLFLRYGIDKLIGIWWGLGLIISLLVALFSWIFGFMFIITNEGIKSS